MTGGEDDLPSARAEDGGPGPSAMVGPVGPGGGADAEDKVKPEYGVTPAEVQGHPVLEDVLNLLGVQGQASLRLPAHVQWQGGHAGSGHL